jgi:hypothetical protein
MKKIMINKLILCILTILFLQLCQEMISSNRQSEVQLYAYMFIIVCNSYCNDFEFEGYDYKLIEDIEQMNDIFRYLGSILQSDREIDENVSHRIRVR